MKILLVYLNGRGGSEQREAPVWMKMLWVIGFLRAQFRNKKRKLLRELVSAVNAERFSRMSSKDSARSSRQASKQKAQQARAAAGQPVSGTLASGEEDLLPTGDEDLMTMGELATGGTGSSRKSKAVRALVSQAQLQGYDDDHGADDQSPENRRASMMGTHQSSETSSRDQSPGTTGAGFLSPGGSKSVDGIFAKNTGAKEVRTMFGQPPDKKKKKVMKGSFGHSYDDKMGSGSEKVSSDEWSSDEDQIQLSKAKAAEQAEEDEKKQRRASEFKMKFFTRETVGRIDVRCPLSDVINPVYQWCKVSDRALRPDAEEREGVLSHTFLAAGDSEEAVHALNQPVDVGFLVKGFSSKRGGGGGGGGQGGVVSSAAFDGTGSVDLSQVTTTSREFWFGAGEDHSGTGPDNTTVQERAAGTASGGKKNAPVLRARDFGSRFLTEHALTALWREDWGIVPLEEDDIKEKVREGDAGVEGEREGSK